MSSSLFGTDGVRGIANETLTPELAISLVRSGAVFFSEVAATSTGALAVGRDTRRSGDMLFGAVVAGITSAGFDVVDLGTVPTPGVAHAAANDPNVIGGVVISASHNPVEYNGIKFFNQHGKKLRVEEEQIIESQMDRHAVSRPIGRHLGRVVPGTRQVYAYLDGLLTALDLSSESLKGLRVAIDCANGAGYRLGPAAFEQAGAIVSVLNANPDGDNINADCGSTHPQDLVGAMLSGGYDVGFALDGDADRLIAVSPSGRVFDGDDVLYIIACWLLRQGRLRDRKVVTTVINNRGLDASLGRLGVSVIHCAVGDREIMHRMEDEAACLGGETSGHILMGDYASTGDGILTALAIARAMQDEDASISELLQGLEKYPQIVINVPVNDKEGFSTDEVIASAVKEAQAKLAPKGRILVRPSGTEPVIRVLVEGPSEDMVRRIAERLATVVGERLGLDCA